MYLRGITFSLLLTPHPYRRYFIDSANLKTHFRSKDHKKRYKKRINGWVSGRRDSNLVSSQFLFFFPG